METMDVTEDLWIMDSLTLKIMDSFLKMNILMLPEIKLVKSIKDLKNFPAGMMFHPEMFLTLLMPLLNNPYLLPLMLITSNSMVVVFSKIVILNLITELPLLDILKKLGLLKTPGELDGENPDTLDLLEEILVV